MSIDFLCPAAGSLGIPAIWDQARRVADEAVAALWAGGLFRGHVGEDRYDAVDGVGFLLLSLLHLATGRPPDYQGLGF